MTYRRLGLLALAILSVRMVWSGCGSDEPERRTGTTLPTTAGNGPQLHIEIVGSEANEDRVKECAEILQRQGVVQTPAAPIRVILTLNENSNRLQVISNRRGVVLRNDPRGGYTFRRLCNDAIQVGLAHLNMEMAQAGAPQPGAPAAAASVVVAPPLTGPPRLALDVTGSEANEDKRQRCRRVFGSGGVGPDPTAPVRVVLTLKDDGNRLQIFSTRRGIQLRNEARPGWGMEQLCADALNQGLAAFRAEAAPPAAAMVPAPPPPAAPTGDVGAPGVMPLHPNAPPKVAELATRGINAYTKGDYSAALGAFAEATRTSKDPALLFNTGVSYYMLKRSREAQQYLQMFISAAPNAPNRQQADLLIRRLQDAEDVE